MNIKVVQMLKKDKQLILSLSKAELKVEYVAGQIYRYLYCLKTFPII